MRDEVRVATEGIGWCCWTKQHVRQEPTFVYKPILGVAGAPEMKWPKGVKKWQDAKVMVACQGG
jgi:hypothetical protein